MKTRKNKIVLPGILAITLVFTMAVIGCEPDPGGPYWERVTGEDAEPFDGTLSSDEKTLTLTINGETITFTKTGNSGGLDGVWEAEIEAEYNEGGSSDNEHHVGGSSETVSLRLTITGTNWIIAVASNGENYEDALKGTLEVSETTVTLTPTHVMVFEEEGVVEPTGPLPDSLLQGTWVGTGYGESGNSDGEYETWEYETEITFNNGKFEIVNDNIPFIKGSYTNDSFQLKLTPTHIYGSEYDLDEKWYTKTELRTAIDEEFLSNDDIDEMFSTVTLHGHFQGNNTLVLINYGIPPQQFTRKGA